RRASAPRGPLLSGVGGAGAPGVPVAEVERGRLALRRLLPRVEGRPRRLAGVGAGPRALRLLDRPGTRREEPREDGRAPGEPAGGPDVLRLRLDGAAGGSGKEDGLAQREPAGDEHPARDAARRARLGR